MWTMREACKGTVFEKLLPEAWGHSEGGWGFNRKAYGAKDISRRTGRMTSRLQARIANMPDAELIAKPIFRPFDEAWLHSTNYVVSAEQIETVRARILGDGIPATSFAAGVGLIGKENAVSGNINYASKASEDWPRDYINGKPIWRHSDIKNVAFRYLSEFFKAIVNESD